MPSVGGSLKPERGLALLLALSLGGCVQRAVLENDVQSAEWKARVLTTQSDWEVAETALSVQLVELEALYQRSPGDGRVTRLLTRGFGLLADGFIEARRLEAIGAEETSEETRQEQRQRAARQRRDYYQKLAPHEPAERAAFSLAAAKQACQARDRAAYQRELERLLVLRERGAEERLALALTRRLAAASLAPAVARRCGFPATE